MNWGLNAIEWCILNSVSPSQGWAPAPVPIPWIRAWRRAQMFQCFSTNGLGSTQHQLLVFQSTQTHVSAYLNSVDPSHGQSSAATMTQFYAGSMATGVVLWGGCVRSWIRAVDVKCEIVPEKGQSANNISEKKESRKSPYVQSSIASGRTTKIWAQKAMELIIIIFWTN